MTDTSDRPATDPAEPSTAPHADPAPILADGTETASATAILSAAAGDENLEPVPSEEDDALDAAAHGDEDVPDVTADDDEDAPDMAAEDDEDVPDLTAEDDEDVPDVTAEDDEDDRDDDEEEAEDAAEEIEAAPRVTFADLGLSDPITRAVAEAGYVTPTPIQEQAIPIVLMGRDVLGTAQTGTGKTAGFTLPMLDILSSGRAKARMPRSLILEPTRELALQVAEQFEKYGKHLKLNHALLIGGESMNEQREVLEKGVDVLIATPGRLLDLFDRGRILLADVKILVIDEADRMLDMGFIPDVERIVSMLPKMRQTLFFSATMAPEIRRLADAFLSNPKEIAVSAPASVATTITAGLVWVRDHDKREALRRLIRREQVQNALIFSNRKVDVDILYKSLKKHGFSVGALHGDMDQPTRFATLNRFKAGELQLLVCSDVAARGLDIGGLSHVFNFDVPFRDEDYVHRIGRTGRAGRQGHAFTIAVADDARLVAAIEKLTGKPIPRIEIDGLDKVSAEEIAEAASRPRGRGRGGSAAGRGGRSGGRDRDRRPGAGGEARRDRGGRPPREDRAPAPREERAAASRDGARPPRDDRRRGEAAPQRDRAPARDEAPRQRDHRGQEDAPRQRDYRAQEDAPRQRDYRGHEDASRQRDYRHDGGRRHGRDDLGPPVRGFGDAVPAFMLIPIPRPRRDAAAAETEAEAA